jgi:exosome complex component RRP40
MSKLQAAAKRNKGEKRAAPDSTSTNSISGSSGGSASAGSAGSRNSGAPAKAGVPSVTVRVVFPGDEVRTESARIPDGVERQLNYPPLGGAMPLSKEPADAMAIDTAASARATASAAAEKGRVKTQASLHVSRAGFLRRGGGSGGGQSRVLTPFRRSYSPCVDDCVIAIVIEESAEWYRCDIGTLGSDPFWPAHTAQTAILPLLAFEGATKRNRPQLAAGTVVYCRIAGVSKHSDVELSCVSPLYKKDWVTGESLFGELVGGHLLRGPLPLGLCESLLAEDNYLLPRLAKHAPFEIAIGHNGRVWISSASPTHTVILANAIVHSFGLHNAVVDKMVKKLFEAIEQ